MLYTASGKQNADDGKSDRNAHGFQGQQDGIHGRISTSMVALQQATRMVPSEGTLILALEPVSGVRK